MPGRLNDTQGDSALAALDVRGDGIVGTSLAVGKFPAESALDVDGDGSVELHEYLTQMKRINRAPPNNFCRTCG